MSENGSYTPEGHYLNGGVVSRRISGFGFGFGSWCAVVLIAFDYLGVDAYLVCSVVVTATWRVTSHE